MSFLIDPYMFELTEESEIKDNIQFFQSIINLCVDHRDPNNGISLVLYKGILNRMNERELQPFPINLGKINDSELKQILLQINNSFSNVLLNYIDEVELDDCPGEQSFSVSGTNGEDERIKEDEHYFEMLYTLLIPCYRNNVNIDNQILTGYKKRGKQIGDSFTISCKCEAQTYSNQYIFVGIDSLIHLSDKLLKKLKQLKNESKIPIVERVRASTNGDHHNLVSSDGKRFQYLEQLSLKNKRVLQLLKCLGLYEVKFGRIETSQKKATTGFMSIINIEENKTQDILNVHFYSETGRTITTALYFPKGVGRIIHDYFDRKQLTYQNVKTLLENL